MGNLRATYKPSSVSHIKDNIEILAFAFKRILAISYCLRKSNILITFIPHLIMFESIIQQIVPPTWESFGVWIPLAFGLSVGLAYVIASAVKHRHQR
ncbi:MAG: hypothetical protein ACRD7F_03410 [Nitrososphaeraceae archaeon]